MNVKVSDKAACKYPNKMTTTTTTAKSGGVGGDGNM